MARRNHGKRYGRPEGPICKASRSHRDKCCFLTAREEVGQQPCPMLYTWHRRRRLQRLDSRTRKRRRHRRAKDRNRRSDTATDEEEMCMNVTEVHRRHRRCGIWRGRSPIRHRRAEATLFRIRAVIFKALMVLQILRSQQRRRNDVDSDVVDLSLKFGPVLGGGKYATQTSSIDIHPLVHIVTAQCNERRSADGCRWLLLCTPN